MASSFSRCPVALRVPIMTGPAQSALCPYGRTPCCRFTVSYNSPQNPIHSLMHLTQQFRKINLTQLIHTNV